MNSESLDESLDSEGRRPSEGSDGGAVYGSGRKSSLDTIQDIKNETRDFVREAKIEIRDQKGVMIFGFLALLVMVAGMLIDIWTSKWESIRDLSSEINKQNLYMDYLNKKIDFLILEAK